MRETPDIKIERGIPIPTGTNQGKGFALRRAMKIMKVGQSFVWPENRTLGREAKQVGVKVTSRKINGEGYRVWRIK